MPETSYGGMRGDEAVEKCRKNYRVRLVTGKVRVRRGQGCCLYRLYNQGRLLADGWL